MKILLFIFLILISISKAQYSDTTSLITLTFSESMSIEGLLDTTNYSVIDEIGNRWKVYQIGIVKAIGNQVINDTSTVVLITKRLAYKRQYRITAQNVKDKAGNLIKENNWSLFYYYGYKPSMGKPNVNFSR